jgi:hypothetical protein
MDVAKHLVVAAAVVDGRIHGLETCSGRAPQKWTLRLTMSHADAHRFGAPRD